MALSFIFKHFGKEKTNEYVYVYVDRSMRDISINN